MSARLIVQHETPTNSLSQSFGVEIFRDDAEGYYTMRTHIRTYDGIKVTESWASEQVRLDAHTENGARAETRDKFREWLKGIGAQA